MGDLGSSSWGKSAHGLDGHCAFSPRRTLNLSSKLPVLGHSKPGVIYKPTDVYQNYIRTYVERDVRKIINVKDLCVFQRFLQLATRCVGNILNRESFCNDVEVSAKTIDNWQSVLDASFVTFRLPPYFENLGKRMIKSPKLYFTDVGVVSYLIGIENITQIFRDPARRHLFENKAFY